MGTTESNEEPLPTPSPENTPKMKKIDEQQSAGRYIASTRHHCGASLSEVRMLPETAEEDEDFSEIQPNTPVSKIEHDIIEIETSTKAVVIRKEVATKEDVQKSVWVFTKFQRLLVMLKGALAWIRQVFLRRV